MHSCRSSRLDPHHGFLDVFVVRVPADAHHHLVDVSVVHTAPAIVDAGADVSR